MIPRFIADAPPHWVPPLPNLPASSTRNLEVLFKAARTPLTVVHVDYCLDNMLFAQDVLVTPAPPPLVVDDFQACSSHGIHANIAYFVGAGLLADDRFSSSSTGRRSKPMGVSADPDDLWHDYVLGSNSGYIRAVIAPQIVVQTERCADMFGAMATRHGQ